MVIEYYKQAYNPEYGAIVTQISKQDFYALVDKMDFCEMQDPDYVANVTRNSIDQDNMMSDTSGFLSSCGLCDKVVIFGKDYIDQGGDILTTMYMIIYENR